MKNYYKGVVEPKRTKKEKKKDTSSLELACALAPNWKEKKAKDWLSYIERNQFHTYMCMANAGAKVVEKIHPKIVVSASPIYDLRQNKTAPTEDGKRGMWLGDLLAIICEKQKITFESRIKSQMLKSDSEAEKEAKKWNDEDTKISKKYSPEKYGYASTDIEEIAGILEGGIGLVITTFATTKEWGMEFPEILIPNLKREDASVHHGIAVVDYGMINGEKFLKIEDSAHFGNRSVRYVNQAWLDKRVNGVGFVIDLGEYKEPTKPSYVFNRDLKYGILKDKDVVALQEALKWFGLMDSRIPSTGNFLGETFRAVIRFQEKYRTEILASIGLREATGNFFKSSRKKMNELLK